jgi:hypothetical protein
MEKSLKEQLMIVAVFQILPCLYTSTFYRVLTMVYNTQNYWVFDFVHRPDSK